MKRVEYRTNEAYNIGYADAVNDIKEWLKEHLHDYVYTQPYSSSVTIEEDELLNDINK